MNDEPNAQNIRISATPAQKAVSGTMRGNTPTPMTIERKNGAVANAYQCFSRNRLLSSSVLYFGESARQTRLVESIEVPTLCVFESASMKVNYITTRSKYTIGGDAQSM